MIGDQKHWRDRATKIGSSHAGILLNDLALHYDELASQAALKDKSPTN
jgi:hypothetical protein